MSAITLPEGPFGAMMGNIEPIQRVSAYAFVQKHHYSAVLPRLTKVCLGARDTTGALAAVATLGWGVRPVHTIAAAFPGLTPADYFELGKLCVRDDMPPNSESWFLSRIIKWLKNNEPGRKVFWTWADGILGKPGYIYQAANFFYGGYITTEIYLDANGTKVHPRTMQGLTTERGTGKRNSRALSVTEAAGYTKWWGRQFRYVYPLCKQREWDALRQASPFEWRRDGYPKDADCVWEVQTSAGGKQTSGPPPWRRGAYISNRRERGGQLSLAMGGNEATKFDRSDELPVGHVAGQPALF